MKIDLKHHFDKYEKLRAAADLMFDKINKDFPECVKCRPKCADCCHALFDLTLIEALYVNHHFHKKFKGDAKATLIKNSNEADRQLYKLKRKAYRDLEAGKDEIEIITEMARERVRCPLLDDQDMCELYDFRPITCRLYGIPTAIGGKAHTCGLTAFEEGKPYPTVNLDKVQEQLYKLSSDLVNDIKSKHIKMADLLVPLSMAILTEYDAEYLGIQRDPAEDKTNKGAVGNG